MMRTRPIGRSAVSEIGLGCMNLNHAYDRPPPPEEGRRLIERALELGVTHFDTAALYGFGRNEELVGPVLKPFGDRIHLATKCGMTGVDGKRVIDGRPETIKATCAESLRRLGRDVIDLYYLHRVDRKVPIEESVGALADLVRAGKVCEIGLSECSAATLRRAHAVHPIAAVQSEYSPWTRNPELGVLRACEDIGATFVAFSPVGRGFLANPTLDPAKFYEHDIRRGMPRFQEPNLAANRAWMTGYVALAREAGCTPAQLAIAWLLHRSPRIIPLFGTTSIAHLEENLGAATVSLTPNVISRVDAIVNPRTVRGTRYAPATQAEIDTEIGAEER